MSSKAVEKAKEGLGRLLEEQLARVESLKAEVEWLDFAKIVPIKIAFIGGDGIGPFITEEARRIFEFLLADELKKGKVEFKTIEGLTIENRAKHNKAIPDDVLQEIKTCHVSLKGPTTTPRKGDPWPNIESANVAMRKELDLFANVRPVRVPKEGIDWIFFRENTEDMYAVGSQGINVTDDLALDFKIITKPGTERIMRLGCEYARKNNIKKVTIITKANVVKTADGMFLRTCYEVAKEYPELEVDDWYIDIMTAKLVDPKRRTQFRVMVLPNLYGDILTDEAAEFQGGVGTAGSANIGKRYSMFEAIHGSAPRMVQEGRGKYADPASVIRGGAMLLNHIGFAGLGKKLEMALDLCGQFEKKMTITGRETGCTTEEYGNYLMETIQQPDIEARWKRYAEK